MFGTKLKPPAEIELIYKSAGPAGQSHVFTATGVGGFYYSSTSLETSFKEVAEALSLHISRVYKTAAKYELCISLSDFKKHLEGEDNNADLDVSDLLLKNAILAKMAGKDRHI